MKTIINIDIMAEDFPAEVEFHYSESVGYVVNVHKIELLSECEPLEITYIYHINDEVRKKINEEITDKYRRGEYED